MTDKDGVTVTLREIYDQVVATKGLTEKLVTKIEEIDKRDGDHETRLRALERWRFGFAGALAIVGVVVPALVEVFSK